MKCAKCGAEIRTGCVYCSACGQEAQIVTELNVLEDDLLRSMLDEPKEKAAKKPEEPEKKPTGKKKKKKRGGWIVLIILLVAVCLIAFGVARYQQQYQSVDYLMGRAQTASAQKVYQTALEFLDRTLALDETNEAAILLKGEICVSMKDDKQAELLFLQVIGNNASSEAAYQNLLRLYDEQDNYEKIITLRAQVTDARMLPLFQPYVVFPPTFDQESGDYSNFFEVSISSDQEEMSIYYTLDGTVPTSNDDKYEGPISISEQGDFVLKAVCQNAKGNYSELATAEYHVELRKPDRPTVTPDGGQFTEAEKITVQVPPGTTVYYVWGDSTPGRDSEKYTEPLTMPEGNNILSLIAIDSYGMRSTVLKCNYIYYPES